MIASKIVQHLLDDSNEAEHASINKSVKQLLAWQAKPRIKISFSRTTPESVEDGDYSEYGWINEKGVDMTPDEYDDEDLITAVDKAVKLLHTEGATEASSSHFHVGVWYSTEFSVINYRTGEAEERSFHLVDFSPQEEKDVWDKFHKKDR